MSINYTVEDLRDKTGAPADLRVVFRSGKVIRSKFTLLLNVNDATNEASICGFERGHSMIDLVIPKKVMGFTIRSIKANAFHLCPNLLTVIIPDSVTTIEDYAFYECVSLISVTIPDSVTKIGVGVFNKCYALKSILTDNPSLLNETGASKEVEIQNQYTAKLLELFEQNADNPNNPELVSLAQKIAYSPILCDFADGIDVIEDVKDFNEVLLKAMLDNKDTLGAVDFGFIKYIHIFNHAGENNMGYINLYIDFPKALITEDKNQTSSGNKVFDDKSLIFLTKNDIGLMGGNIVEYCNSLSNSILDPYFYPVVSLDNNQQCQPSGFIKQWFMLDKEDFDKASNILIPLDKFINEDKSITNVFYIGNYGEKLDRDYSLWANVGIRCVDDKDEKVKACVKAFLEQFRKFLQRISVQIQFGIKRLELRETAARAAVGQVSARNFSHNFGSHVFSKLMGNDTYENIARLAAKKAYLSCYGDLEIDRGEQLACFLQYVKNRMDYLSELSFGVPNILTAKTIYGDVFKELDRVRLLLNYISGVSSFRYEFCLKYNGEQMVEGRDFAVAFPGDVLGSQALYNILENIIRNTAKHAMRHGDRGGCETFTIEFFDGEKFPEYYCVEIDNGIQEQDIDELVKRQNKYINNTILDKTNTLRGYNLGLLEIEASAAFLRQIDVVKIESYEYGFGEDDIDEYYNSLGNLIILKAINKNGALGCRFFLQKPKEFLFVGDDWNIDTSSQKRLLNLGIRIVGSDEFVKQLRVGKSFAHQFLIYNEAITDNAETMLLDGNENKTLLPIRKLKFNREQSQNVLNILKSTDENDIIRQLKEIAWDQYFQKEVQVNLKNPANGSLIINSSVVEPDENTPMPPNQITFLNHSTGELHETNWKVAQNNGLFEAWVENLTSRSSIKLPEFSTLSVGKRGPVSDYLRNIDGKNAIWIKQALFAAYHEPVVVIDERVQIHSQKYEGSSNENSGPISVSALYESTNVLFPDPTTMPLDPERYDEEMVNNVETFINDNCDNAFLLIHYGVLERMYKRDSNIEETAVIRGKLTEWAAKAKRLVVTSGRGSHSLPLPPSVCFADLSSVLYALVSNRNKYMINYLLHQARRKNE